MRIILQGWRMIYFVMAIVVITSIYSMPYPCLNADALQILGICGWVVVILFCVQYEKKKNSHKAIKKIFRGV